MKQELTDRLLMIGSFVVYIVLFQIWLRVAPDPGWGDIELIFLFIPVLTTIILFGVTWGVLLGGILAALYIPVVWPSLVDGRVAPLEVATKFALLVVLGIGAEIFKRYEIKKRDRLAQLANGLREKVNQQTAIMRAQQALGQNLNLRNQFEEFLHWATELVAAKEGYITLYNQDTKRLELVYLKADDHDRAVPKTLANALASGGDGIAKEERIERFIARINAAPNSICVPLRVREELIGALCLTAADKTGQFSQNDLELISMLGAKAAVAIENARLHELNTQLFIDSVRALAKVIDARDPMTKNHSDGVAEHAGRLARQLGLGQSEVDRVELAAELHDIGRIVVPDRILKKPGRLTAKEYQVVKKHPETGHELLKEIQSFDGIAPAVLYHHERFDGTGYPEGLKGEEIPLIARIIALADTYDALRSARSHRGKATDQQAAKVLQEVAGSQLDPHLVDVFLSRSGARRRRK